MKKKILVFIPTFPVLSETFIEREVDGLVRSRRLNVEVVSLKKGTEFRSEKAEGVTTHYRLNVVDACLGLLYFLTSPTRTIEAWKTLGFSRVYLFLKSLGYSRVFAKFKPDFIYAQFLSEPSSIALVVSIILDVPLGISAHARDVLEYPDLVREKVSRAKFITFCNKNALNKAVELSGMENPPNMKLIYHGVNPDDLKQDPNGLVGSFTNFVFSVGRLTEKKGFKYLIAASEILKSRGVLHTIYIAGGGPLHGGLNALIQSKNLRKNVVLLGATAFSEVVAYHHAADVYVQPSVDVSSGDAEGITNGLIEAALVKVPIVATDAGSFTDFLDDSISVMVPQRDSQALADGIEKLLKDKTLRSEVRNAAYERASEMFDIGKSIRGIEELILS
jgi:glycosyltransferase involved in cell wall biosynthesis